MLISAACLSAAPRLRLGSTALGPFSIVAGANGPQQTVPVANIGTGTFTFTLTSSASWLSATYTAGATCTSVSCGQIAITLATSALAKGPYTGTLTVLDPNAIDAPQNITVTVNIGGTVPDAITLYATPGGSTSTTFTTGMKAKGSATGAAWLSVASSGAGSFQFDIPWTVTANAATLAANTYSGNLTFIGSDFTPDNKEIPVTFNVTSMPIIDPGNTSLKVLASTPTGPGAAETLFVWMGNIGQGTLVAGSTTVTVDTGAWMSVPYVLQDPAGLLMGITVDPTGIAVGPHIGTVQVNTNADNQPTTYTVELDVVGTGATPAINWPRILNVSNYNEGDSVCPGDIVVVYGTDFLEGDPINVTATPPLPTTVGTAPDNVQVLVNGTPAPIFYASYSQINIQIPFETSTAQPANIQVSRNGVLSPVGTVKMATAAPLILEFNCLYSNVCPAPYQPYGIGVNNNTITFPIPTVFPIYNPTFPSHPATAGDIIIFYAVGLGQTVPPLVTGAAAPSGPLAQLPNVNVCFQSGVLATPVCTLSQYYGATPTEVGLYQVNVQIPPNAPKGDAILMTVGNSTNPVKLAIQ